MVSRNTALVPSLGLCNGPAFEAGLSVGMRRDIKIKIKYQYINQHENRTLSYSLWKTSTEFFQIPLSGNEHALLYCQYMVPVCWYLVPVFWYPVPVFGTDFWYVCYWHNLVSELEWIEMRNRLNQ